MRCIGSDPRRAHGLRPALVLADEPAQWEHTKSDAMLAALRTGLGKVPGSRLIALGTRPADPNHWFAKLLDGGAAYAQTHAVPVECETIFSGSYLRRANPSMEHLPSLLARIRTEADEAKRDEALLPSFRALRLNQGTSDVLVRMLLSAISWEKIEGEADAIGGYHLGIDLGTTAAMSAAAAYWPESGRLESVAVFGDSPDLRQRGLTDGVGRRYIDMHRRDELVVSPGRVSDPGVLLAEVKRRWGAPASITADRWREGELRDVLQSARFPMADLVTRGQGWRDGAEDVRGFRKAVLEGQVTPVVSLLMRAAMAEARVVSDAAGNEKLTKGRRRHRDDAAAAAILAVATGTRKAARSAGRRGVYLGRFRESAACSIAPRSMATDAPGGTETRRLPLPVMR